MLRRYRYKLEGEYNQYELRDIYKVSQFLYFKVGSGENKLTELEKDYIRYSKQVFWNYTKVPTFVACGVFMVADMVYPVSTLRFFPRMFIKFVSAGWVMKQGVNLAYQKILEFPMLDVVVAEAMIKYTEWIDIDK